MDVLRLSGASPSSWERFLEGRDGVDAPLIDRWSRVRALGVSPFALSDAPIVSASKLHERRDRHGELLHAASAVLEGAARAMSEQHYTLLLCDPDGMVLARWGGGQFEPTAERARLIAGADWSEQVRGTNAIGTGLAEGRAVAVEGCAHYVRDNHALACYASPLFAPDGRLMGLVDATSYSASANALVSVAVSGIARSIEDRLSALAWRRTGAGQVARMMERLPEPAALVDEGGQVHFANRAARPALFGAVLPRLLRDAAGAWSPPAGAEGWEVRAEPVLAGMQVLYFHAPRVAARPVRSSAFDRLLGSDPALLATKDKAARFARTSLPVLLLAETGTGKELLARALHEESPRRSGPFVAVNCGAFSSQLLETELFGYGGGAFTGARVSGQAGKLEASHGGSLFLDEVAEMPPTVQAMLLRVLEDGAFYRVGESQPRAVDLRLICATCRDLEALVKAGTFRSDLYFRIRGATLSLPPLAERTDRAELALALLERLAAEQGRPPPRLSAEVLAWVRGHDWPGNVRELKSTLAHALALAEDEVHLEHLPRALTRSQLRSGEPAAAPLAAEDLSREDAERRALVRAIDHAQGNLTAAARHLGVARSTLYRMMERYGLTR